MLYDANNGVHFATQTTRDILGPQVTPPCRTQVSGAGGGFLVVIDSFASGDQSDTALYTRPFVGNGVMKSGQILPQVRAAMPWATCVPDRSGHHPLLLACTASQPPC